LDGKEADDQTTGIKKTGSGHRPLLSTPTVHAGAKTATEKFLEKNPELAALHHEAMVKVHGPDYKPLNMTDLSNIETVHEYAAYELARSANENVLRGETFVKYMRIMLEILAFRLNADNSIRIAEGYADAIRNNKDEVDAFYKSVCAVIVQKISDEKSRKEFIESIKKLYDDYYTQQKAIVEQLQLEYPLASEKFKLSPQQNIGESKE
jgi:hypothetical protein